MTKFSLFTLLITFFTIPSIAQKQVSREWTSVVQAVEVSVKENTKFKLTGSVKVETSDTTAWAGLWARVDSKEGGSSFFDNMGNRPIKDNQWKEYTIEGELDNNSIAINIGGLCLFNGDFYFDNLRLYIQDEKGIYQPFPILNGDFEKAISDEGTSNWIEGILPDREIKIEEYTLKGTPDAVSGKQALLISAKGVKPQESSAVILPKDGYTPQIGVLISMLENLKNRVQYTVQNMDQFQTDYLIDENANRIGALVMHLAATEAIYQQNTFGVEYTPEEQEKWNTALSLDEGGRNNFKGQPISYYLAEYDKVRARTLELFKTKDDAWFNEVNPGEAYNYHYFWFHVMEHQSSHLGQILFLRKRIPKKGDILLQKEIKD